MIFRLRLMTVDETWVHYYEPENKALSRQWVGSGSPSPKKSYGENLIARCSQVHDNFTMGVNRKILINLIYLFIQETYLTCANGL